MLSERAVELLPRCSFPPAKSPIACAVSGGADSLALLALAVCAGCDATAYHVDHGIRPGSASEADEVAQAAERIGARFVSLSVEVPPGPNLEARARAPRFKVLPEGVATGHTADDQAETILLNLLRGSGRSGLSGMRVGPRHPILGLRRTETVGLCASLGLVPFEDPSNAEPAYRRNRVRREVLPLLAEIAARDLVPILNRQSELFAEENDLLDELAAVIDPTDAVALRSAPPALSRRAVRSWLRSLDPEGYPPDAAAVERVLEVARGGPIACEVAGGRRVRRTQGRLRIDEA